MRTCYGSCNGDAMRCAATLLNALFQYTINIPSCYCKTCSVVPRTHARSRCTESSSADIFSDV
ncbi:hypothetical protein DL98DRAFT_215146 [Cadophora sp. DSE1049]|nr:hypothetical protein DL98DRAFT_215146 [Cadophora sp. DSE1049]